MLMRLTTTLLALVIASHQAATVTFGRDQIESDMCATYEQNLDYFGNDIKSTQQSTPGACCNDCNATPGCRLYVWNNGICWLKKAASGRTSSPGSYSAFAEPNPVCSNFQPNVDYYGNDIKSTQRPSYNDCCADCMATPGCKLYVWNNANGGTCWLKNAKGAQSSQPGAYAASYGTPPQGCTNYQQNVDYYGNDIKSTQRASPNDCCSDCSATPGCKLYVWNNANGGTCWLKNAQGPASSQPGAYSASIPSSTGSCGAVIPNTDFTGQDVGNVPGSTPAQCCAACLSSKACNAYSIWNNICWLKSGSNAPHAATGVTAATVNKCSALQSNVDYAGNDIANAPSADASGCCALCRNTNGCKAFSWSQGVCYFKSAQGSSVNKAGVVSAVVLINNQQNVDYFGNDIKFTLRGNPSDCCGDCAATSGCVLYVWTNTNGGTCYLKNAKGNPSTVTGAQSASVDNPVATCNNYQQNVDYFGNDIKSTLRSSPNDCCGDCVATPTCVVYVWTSTNGGTCYLKNAKGAVSSLPGAFSASIPSSTSCGPVLANTDIANQDITNVPGSTPDQCCSACTNNKACNAYSLSNNVCYLKTGNDGQHTANGVTSGTVYKCTPLQSNVDFPGNDIGVDYFGNDIVSTARTIPNDCCGDCAGTPGCQLYVWTNTNSGTCYLKTAQSNPSSLPGASSAIVNTAGTCTNNQQGLDYFGNDIKSTLRPSSSFCCNDCASTPNCVLYVWTNTNGGTCYLKNAISSPTLLSGASSGFVGSTTCGAVIPNTDYTGQDVANVPGSTPVDCCNACVANTQCNAYVLYNNVCYLKSGTNGKISATNRIAASVNKCSTLQSGVDYIDNDIGNSPSTDATGCCAKCRNTPNCHAFSCRVVLGDTYDVIVVGSGPGGLVAAEYLSRSNGISVLVLEAGGLSLAATGGKDIPSYAASQGLTRFDIPGEYSSVAFSQNNQYRMNTDWVASPGHLWLGKVIGGSSSLNGMLYFHTPDSYVTEANWPYSADAVNQAYLSIEKVFSWTNNPSPDGKRYKQEAYNIVKDALSNGGYKEASGINDPTWRNTKSKTFGHPPFAIKNGLRDSPAKTFLGAAKTRSNFKLISSATVSYIVQKKGKATGVVYDSNGQSITVNLSTRGAVIVAGSAAMTPKILIQSGIGPKSQLQMLSNNKNFPGIGSDSSKWVVNENVGSNMFDTHQLLMTFTRNDMTAFIDSQNPTSAIQQYMTGNHAGPWSSPNPVLVAYENYTTNNRNYQFQVTTYCRGYSTQNVNKNLGVAIYLNNPVSRDIARFTSDGKYHLDTQKSMYNNPNDRAAVITYVDKFRKMMTDRGVSAVKPVSNIATKDFVQSSVEGANHYGGSCYTSGDKNDKNRCADETFRVVGTSNIYIGDGSLMKEGTVNPYGFIMQAGYQAGVNVQNAILRSWWSINRGKDIPSYVVSQGLTRFDIPGEYLIIAFGPNNQYRMNTDWAASPSPLWLGKVIGGSSSLNRLLYFHTPDSYVTEANWPNSAAAVNQAYSYIEKKQEAYNIFKEVFTKGGYKEASGINDPTWRNAKSKTFGHPPFKLVMRMATPMNISTTSLVLPPTSIT
ncbi:carbohydrate-binding protein, partial [Thraustotheca clavata]